MKHSFVLALLLLLFVGVTFVSTSAILDSNSRSGTGWKYQKKNHHKNHHHKKRSVIKRELENESSADCGPSITTVDHNVTYIHQVFDTDDSFCGYWACGPTSTVMALAYYKKIQPKPIKVTKLFNHVSDYGFYISHQWTSPTTGFVFNRGQADSCGKIAYGAYGHGTDDGLAWAWRLQEVLKYNGLNNKFYDSSSVATIAEALQKGRLVILSTRLTSGGHLVLIKGYEIDAKGNVRFIANDPYGDRNDPATYGKKHNGAGVKYTWELLQAKWMIEVIP